MDNRVIHDLGVIRVSAAQVVSLACELLSKRATVDNLLDIEQPEHFEKDVSWSYYEREQE